MSYDVDLVDSNNATIFLPYSHSEGGTYVQGGTNEASLNITYNYSKFYYETIDKEDGLRWLHDKLAGETVDRLFAAVKILGVNRYTDEYLVIKADLTWGQLSGNKPTTHQQEFINQYLPNFPSQDDVELLSDSIKELGKSLKVLYDTGGYWKATPGNAGHALNILLNWALQCPNSKWQVH